MLCAISVVLWHMLRMSVEGQRMYVDQPEARVSLRMKGHKTWRNVTSLPVDWRRKMKKEQGKSCQSLNKRFVDANVDYCFCFVYILYIMNDVSDCVHASTSQTFLVFSLLLQSPERNYLKLAVLIYRCLHGLSPRYLPDHIQRVADFNRRRLRSSSSLQLVIRHTWLSTIGDCAILVGGSHLWNSLPPNVTSAAMLTAFRNCLKTYLFSPSFPFKLFLA